MWTRRRKTPSEPTERTVVDSGGTAVTVPAQVEAVMTFGSCGVINTLIETLGCGWMIANDMSPRFSDNPAWHNQYEFAPQMAELPRYENASGEIDIESVVAADPDLIIVMQAATAETLREKGLNVLYIQFTAEDVLAWNPDVIMMITDNSADLKADAKINSVSAIANDQLFVFPTVGHFLTGSSEAPLGILWLTYHLYPDLYTEDALADDIYYFYDTFFGYQMSDEEIDAIINNN